MRPFGTATCVLVALALLLSGLASANGGANIANAPTIQIGKTMFGNTVDGCFSTCYAADYWKLPLISSDQVTVDWESASGNCGPFAANINVYPVGTTDFSINNTNRFYQDGLGDNGKQEAKFTANTTGVFPVIFESGGYGDQPSDCGGGYDFVVKVAHKLVTHLTASTTALLARGHSSGLPRTGTFSLQVYSADGKPISGSVGGTLVANWAGAWQRIGQAVARSGVVAVHYRLPSAARGAIKLRIDLGGGSFQGKHLSYGGLKV